MRFSGRKRAFFLLVPVLVIGGLFWLRHEAHGFHNALSPSYWSDHISGKYLYDPELRFLRHGDPSVKEIALTFDDGPHPESAQEILDVLKARNIKATFFLVGSRIKEHPEIVRRMIEEGHVVGNHTQDHLRLCDLNPRQIANEIEDCEINFERAVPGRQMRLFRPPGMRFNSDVLAAIRRLGYVMVGWDEAAKDFISAEHPHADPNLVRERILSQLEDGSIILLHDIPSTAEVLAPVLDEIERRGYRFVTVTEMLNRVAPNAMESK